MNTSDYVLRGLVRRFVLKELVLDEGLEPSLIAYKAIALPVTPIQLTIPWSINMSLFNPCSGIRPQGMSQNGSEVFWLKGFSPTHIL